MKGFKTILASLAIAIIGFLEQFDVTNFVGDKYDGLALALVAMVMAVLRLVTTTPIGKND